MARPTEPATSAPTCCPPDPDPRIARDFDARYADWEPDDAPPTIADVTARLLDRLRDAPLRRPSVLEIGCGTGGLSVALLEMGARRVTGIDLSASSVALARRRAEAAGFGAQAEFAVADAAGATFEPHDWLVLDRVLCCDARADLVLDAALGAAPSRIALSVPESRGWRGLVNRPLWFAENVWDRVRGGCLGHVHDLRAIERRLARAGYRPAGTAPPHAGLWFVGVYERDVAEVT